MPVKTAWSGQSDRIIDGWQFNKNLSKFSLSSQGHIQTKIKKTNKNGFWSCLHVQSVCVIIGNEGEAD